MTGPKNPRELTIAELADDLGVTERQVTRWLFQGCPSQLRKGTGRGRPHRVFDVLAVKTWLVSRGIAPRLKKGLAHLLADDLPASEPVAGAAPAPQQEAGASDTSGARELGYSGMLARLRVAERTAFTSWAVAVRAKSDVGYIGALSKMWLEKAAELRKAEAGESRVRQGSAEWVLRSDSDAAMARAATEVKTLLLALPRAAAPRLVGLMAPEIEAVLDGEIRSALEVLATARWDGDGPH